MRIGLHDGGSRRSTPTLAPCRSPVPPSDLKDKAFPLSACIDDRGLTYALDQDYDTSKIFGGSFGAAGGRATLQLRITKYGKAKPVERPAGIDTAKTP